MCPAISCTQFSYLQFPNHLLTSTYPSSLSFSKGHFTIHFLVLPFIWCIVILFSYWFLRRFLVRYLFDFSLLFLFFSFFAIPPQKIYWKHLQRNRQYYHSYGYWHISPGRFVIAGRFVLALLLFFTTYRHRITLKTFFKFFQISLVPQTGDTFLSEFFNFPFSQLDLLESGTASLNMVWKWFTLHLNLHHELF